MLPLPLRLWALPAAFQRLPTALPLLISQPLASGLPACRKTEQALEAEREGAQQLLAEKAELEQRLEEQVCEGAEGRHMRQKSKVRLVLLPLCLSAGQRIPQGSA